MEVGTRTFTGKGAREEAAKALTYAVLSWRDDQTVQTRGSFRGFEILSKGRTGAMGLDSDASPDLFVRGKATYSANLNPTNPVGTVQSIEHTLRSLDKFAADQQSQLQRIEKELADYKSQADRPFEHQQKLTELLKRQAELHASLDLDKGDQQAVESPEAFEQAAEPQHNARSSAISEMALSYMRDSGAILEMPIVERKPPETGSVTGRAVAVIDTEVAIATAANSFVVVQVQHIGSRVQIGARLTIQLHNGQAMVDKEIGLCR